MSVDMISFFSSRSMVWHVFIVPASIPEKFSRGQLAGRFDGHRSTILPYGSKPQVENFFEILYADEVSGKTQNNMSFQFTWTQDLSVGNVALDQEHQRLLAQVNTLIDAIVSGRGPVVVTPAVEFLNTYVDEHFANEEKYMRENGYPDLEAHIAVHHRFREQYAELKKKIELQGPSEELLLDIENKLARWWIEHIGVQDKKYAVFIALREKNR